MRLPLLAGISLLTLFGTTAHAVVHAAESSGNAPIRVAFVISELFNVMDFAGPWEVFQDATIPASAPGTERRQAFEIYTVASKPDAVNSTGGARVVPTYTLQTAPPPDIVIIGAQSDRSPELMAWLRQQHSRTATVASVCTGASKLAQTGLLDGKQATTHHEFVAGFRERYPKVTWLETQRFVHSGDRLYTAGGLTSGIDLALHLVAMRLGEPVAQATADYMEYRSDGWKRPD
jgi:transcriptional regulator GlxA family with amidase domain